jgi:hypothetical protein
MEMMRYRPPINVPGKNLPALHEECDELSPDNGREPERELAGLGDGADESIVACTSPISAVMLAANSLIGRPQ